MENRLARFGRFLIIVFLLGMSSFSSLAAQDETPPHRLIVADMNFTTYQSTLSRINIDNGEVEKLLTVNAPEAEFRMSPQGNQVAYAALLDWEKAWDCCPETGANAYMFDLASGENKLLAENNALEGSSTSVAPVAPVWSPDGQQVMFIHLDDQLKSIMTIAEGDTIRSFKPDRFPTGDALWSSDGTMLAYYSDIVSRSSYGLVFAVRTDGTDTGRVLLTNNDPPQDIDTDYGYSVLGWIPDTHDLLVTRGIFYKEGHELLRVNADDGTVQVLIPTDKMPDGYALDILDDGRGLFATNFDSDYGVSWLDWDSGALTPAPIQGGLLARWVHKVYSSDQTKAAITSYDEKTKIYGIAVYNLETSAELANIPVTTDYIYGFTWSPDGQYIAVATAAPLPATNTAIYVVNADGSGTTRQIAEDVGTTLIGWQT